MIAQPLHDEDQQSDLAMLRLLEGQALQPLAAIRDQKLFRWTHATFAEYLAERFGQPEKVEVEP